MLHEHEEKKAKNAELYFLKHSHKYKSEKKCASRCGQGSPYNHRGALKARRNKESTSLKMENKILVQKGLINCSGELNYRCNKYA